MLDKTQDEIMRGWGANSEIVVSIHCLAYNHEKFIQQSLDSFLSQETNFPFEVVVHDDASTDSTQKIIKEYEKKYPKIIVPIYETENQFGQGTLNGIISKKIRGSFVAFCEGDDFWISSHKLQDQIDFLLANRDYSGCVGACLVLDDKTGICRPREKKYPKFDLELNDFIGPTIGHTSTIVMRRSVYFELLSPEVPDVFSGDKVSLLLMRLNGKVAFLPKVFSVYRKSDVGISRNVKYEYIKKDLQIPSWAKKRYERGNTKRYPYIKHLSYIYQTIFLFTKDLNWNNRMKYGLLFFFSSFAYFPRNIVRILKITKAFVKGKKFT